jgi:hypothetical protein
MHKRMAASREQWEPGIRLMVKGGPEHRFLWKKRTGFAPVK